MNEPAGVPTLEERVAALEAGRAAVLRVAGFAVAALILTLVFTFVWTGQVNKRTERKFCAILASNSSSAPTTTERGADIARKLHTLTRELGCPPEPAPLTAPPSGGSK